MLGNIRFPEIQAHHYIDDRVEIHCLIPHDLSYCDGHFAGMPIVPGVTQLHWAVYYAKEFFDKFEAVLGASQIKFTNIIKPNTKITLSLKNDVEQKVIHYRYFDAEKSYSSGRFSYGDETHDI